MDFDTGNTGAGRGGGGGHDFARDLFSTSSGGGSSSWWVRIFGGNGETRREREQNAEARARGAAYRIPGGSRKEVLVHLAVAIWRAGGFVAKDDIPEVRGHDLDVPGDETKLLRALSRTSMGQIEHVLGQHVRGRRIVVDGHLAGSARSAIERLGGEVEELSLDDEKRYIDMTPIIFVFAAVAMAVRYISLGLDNQEMYILAGLGFALMYGLRPFFFKMQRPRES